MRTSDHQIVYIKHGMFGIPDKLNKAFSGSRFMGGYGSYRDITSVAKGEVVK